MPSVRRERGIVGVTDRVGDEADRHGRAAEGNHPHAELVDVDIERRTAVFRRRAVAAVLRVAVHRVTPSLHVPCNSSSYRHRRGSGRGPAYAVRRAGFEGAGLGNACRRERRAHPGDGEQSRQRRARVGVGGAAQTRELPRRRCRGARPRRPPRAMVPCVHGNRAGSCVWCSTSSRSRPNTQSHCSRSRRVRSKAPSFETELLTEPTERDRGLILDRGEEAHVVRARRAGEHTRARGDCESVHRCPQRAVDERAPAAHELHDGDVAAAFGTRR